MLDIVKDRYLWKGEATAESLPQPATVPADQSAVALNLKKPLADGFAPRGPDRFWRFELGLVISAFRLLLHSFMMAARGFPGFVEALDAEFSAPVRRRVKSTTFAQVSAAMEWARLIIPCEAKCLPIAIATARLARTCGINASLVVGVQALPLQAHAWAQVDSALINDFLDRVTVYEPIFMLPLPSASP